ncbi:hypothetical protein OQA88_979 [Cercophora sp. LCS_1]
MTNMSLKSLPQLTLYRGFAVVGCHVWSPFVNKLETRLRIAGVSYRVEAGSMREAPRGKIPYVAIQDDAGSELLGDTTLIIRRLIDDKVLPDLSASLTPSQRAQDLAIRALLEDKLCPFLTRERWIDNYYTMRAGALAALPYLAQLVVGPLAYHGVTRTLYGQGAGRFTDAEAREFKREVWDSLAAILTEVRNGDAAVAARRDDPRAPFWVLGRAEPSEADATIYGFLAASLVCDAAPETREMVGGFPVLMDYAARIRDKWFADYEGWDVE